MSPGCSTTLVSRAATEFCAAAGTAKIPTANNDMRMLRSFTTTPMDESCGESRGRREEGLEEGRGERRVQEAGFRVQELPSDRDLASEVVPEP
jgi:hypothetical protein